MKACQSEHAKIKLGQTYMAVALQAMMHACKRADEMSAQRNACQAQHAATGHCYFLC